MEFEWDEAKRLENFHRRGVDFALAAVVFEDPARFEIEDNRQDYGESRRMVIGSYEGETYVFVFTMRENVCRVIIGWKVGEHGRRRYQALHQRRTQGDG